MDNEMTQEEFLAKLQAAPLFKTILLPTNLLVQAEYNPQIINDSRFQALKKSMQEDQDFLKVRPVIVNVYPGREGIVIGGNKRLLAAQELEMPKIPAILVNVPIDKEKAYNLKDNINAGDWDPVKRKEVIMDLHDSGYDMSTIGFGSEEVVDIMDVATSTALTNKEDDPDNHGGTPGRAPKVKIAEGAELQCPHCHTKFSYSVGVQVSPPEDDEEDS